MSTQQQIAKSLGLAEQPSDKSPLEFREELSLLDLEGGVEGATMIGRMIQTWPTGSMVGPFGNVLKDCGGYGTWNHTKPICFSCPINAECMVRTLNLNPRSVTLISRKRSKKRSTGGRQKVTDANPFSPTSDTRIMETFWIVIDHMWDAFRSRKKSTTLSVSDANNALKKKMKSAAQKASIEGLTPELISQTFLTLSSYGDSDSLEWSVHTEVLTTWTRVFELSTDGGEARITFQPKLAKDVLEFIQAGKSCEELFV